MADIYFHIERPSARSRYVVAHVLGTMAGWEAVEITDLEQFRNAAGPKLIYGRSPVDAAFHLVPQGLLERTDLAPEQPLMSELEAVPVLYPVVQSDLPFDPLAGAFFLLSRYEEYGDLARDTHGRPVTAAMHATRHGYLHRPVVDEWLYLLAKAWRTKDPRLPELRRQYAHTATLDADNGAMYLGRSWWRSLGGAARDLLTGKPERVLRRAAVLRGKQADPYAVHDQFLHLAEEHGATAIINFLVADRGKHDHAISLATAYMRHVLASAAQRGSVGFHPGYASSAFPDDLRAQKQRLEQALGGPVVRSRQHFLRMQLSETYRQLEALGIREEHSMGLSDQIGFRAGTCTPYPFFDLEADRSSALVVHPFAVMDSALCYKMLLQPQEAVDAACRMADAVRKVQGRFISVWHERFLSGYGDEAGWETVAPQVLKHARP
jgi:hypothetical protein